MTLNPLFSFKGLDTSVARLVSVTLNPHYNHFKSKIQARLEKLKTTDRRVLLYVTNGGFDV